MLKKIIIIVVAVFAAITAIALIVNNICLLSTMKWIDGFEKVDNPEAIVPVKNGNGDYVYKTDRDLKILDLTDVHIGGGWLSLKKDRMSMNSVAAMISAEKPDLVVVTGDIGYPVPVFSGTFNNKLPVMLFTKLMEKLGVYYTVTLGNHDSESYSFFSRKSIGEAYGNSELKYSLFQMGPEDVDGVGNQLIRVENSEGKPIQGIFVVDSHSYTDGDIFGLFWKYDNIHDNQVEWYKQNVIAMQKENPDVKSMMFFHIPLVETRDAYDEYRANGMKDTENVKYISGAIGEKEPYVYSGIGEDNMFETILELGSTKALFFGHDHKNNLCLNYKGVDMIYNKSIDYLAYIGIYKIGDYRGCTVINLKQDGSYTFNQESYYQDKYPSTYPKEAVDFETR